MRLLTRLPVLIGATIASFACDNPVNPLPNVTASVAVSSSVIRGNETTQITTTFVNTGLRDAHISSKSCGPRFSVINEDGERLSLGSAACTLELPPPLLLAPGERAQFTETWNGRDRYGIRTLGDYRITVNGFDANAAVVRVLD